MTIGDDIRLHRRKKKMSREELGELVYKSASSIRHYENGGNVPHGVLRQIMEALDMNKPATPMVFEANESMPSKSFVVGEDEINYLRSQLEIFRKYNEHLAYTVRIQKAIIDKLPGFGESS